MTNLIKLLILLALATLAPLGAISRAQEAPLAVKAELKNFKTEKIFTVACPHCGLKLARYPALTIVTNGGVSAPGGIICQRTITFICPQAECGQVFTARNEKFCPTSIAVEDDPLAGGAGDGGRIIGAIPPVLVPALATTRTNSANRN